MAITTYTELQAAVASWLARDDLTARIPEFIALAEAKLNRKLRSNRMETRATATVNLASDEPEFIALPGDFQRMRRVRLSSVTGKPSLTFLTGQQADTYRFNSANATGRPLYFTIFGDELEMIPTPDLDYTIEMVYSANLDALADDNESNWLLDIAPDAYLYGALLEAAPYMKDDDRIAVWATGLVDAVNDLNTLSKDQSYNAGPLEVRVSGQPTP